MVAGVRGPLWARLLSIPLMLGLILYITLLMIGLIPGSFQDFEEGRRLGSEATYQRGLMEGSMERAFTHTLAPGSAVTRPQPWWISTYYHAPIWTLLARRAPVSLLLTIGALGLVYAIAVPLGARRKRRDSVLLAVGYAVPPFLLATVLLTIFAGSLDWFALRGLTSENWQDLSLPAKCLDLIRHLTLPLLSLVLATVAPMVVLVRRLARQAWHQPHCFVALSKGLSHAEIRRLHLRQDITLGLLAKAPGQFVGLLCGGTFVVEIIFSLNGLGRLGYDALLHRDAPLMAASLLSFTALSMIFHLLGDYVQEKYNFQKNQPF